MISAKHRFHGRNSLRHIYSRGNSVRVGSCVFKYLKNERRADYRMAVIVSKKVSKKAVVRNKIRRRFFETVRTHQEDILPSYDFMFTVFSEEFATMPSSELKKIIQSCFLQAGLLKKS